MHTEDSHSFEEGSSAESQTPHTHTLAQKHLLQLLYGIPLAADRDMFSAGGVVSGAILGPIPKGGAYAIRSHPGGLGNLHHTSWSK